MASLSCQGTPRMKWPGLDGNASPRKRRPESGSVVESSVWTFMACAPGSISLECALSTRRDTRDSGLGARDSHADLEVGVVLVERAWLISRRSVSSDSVRPDSR